MQCRCQTKRAASIEAALFFWLIILLLLGHDYNDAVDTTLAVNSSGLYTLENFNLLDILWIDDG